MALHVGLRRAVTPAAIVGYSGMLVIPNDGPADTMAAEIKSRPPVLLVHGDRDELIPVQALLMAAQGLAALEVPVSGISRRALATASIRKACVTAANFWPSNFAPSPERYFGCSSGVFGARYHVFVASRWRCLMDFGVDVAPAA